MAGGDAECVRAVRRLEHSVPALLKDLPRELADVALVLDEEDGLLAAR